MNKQELFLKYLDKQLSEQEALEVINLVEQEAVANQLFEEVRLKKMKTLRILDQLNPEISINAPIFNPVVKKVHSNNKRKKVFTLNIWHHAAVVIILLCLSVGLWLFNRDYKEPYKESSGGGMLNDFDYEVLECYISPNRCWNNRELTWTFIELNQK